MSLEMMDPDTVVFIEIPSMIKKENSYISQIKQDQKVFWFRRVRGDNKFTLFLVENLLKGWSSWEE